MNKSDRPRPRIVRTWGVVLGTMVAAALAVVSFGSLAGAADDGTGEPGTSSTTPANEGVRTRPVLTDEQKQCLADQGVTLPEKPADGTRPPRPTDEQRAAFRAAAEACGLPARPLGRLPGGPGHRLQLTDEQKQCLADQGVTLPEKPADGTRPPRPTDEQRAAFRAAAEACGLPTPPARAGVQGTSV